jgi:hypothetical protein
MAILLLLLVTVRRDRAKRQCETGDDNDNGAT